MLLTQLDITIALPHHQTTLIHLVLKKHATCPSMSSSFILEHQPTLFTS
jgi:hypothetical protein